MSVDATTGELKALAAGGPVVITATAGTITAPCQVTVQALKYAITLENDGRGTGALTVNGAGAEEAEQGATIALNATPAAGYIFKQWTVVEGGITPAPGSATGTATFTMPAGPVTLRAEFTIETVKIPAGTFMMGSPPRGYHRMGEVGGDDYELQHSVTLTKGFYMGKYEVTNAQFAAFLNAKGVEYATGLPTPVVTNPVGGKLTWGEFSGKILFLTDDWGLKYEGDRWVPQSGYENHPAVRISRYGALEYARWLGGTLPTEAQWEYACRGDYPNKATETNTMPFGVGTGRKLVAGMANFKATKPYDLDRKGRYTDDTQSASTGTTAVGSYPANNYGLHDMHGNVSEWCLDWYTELYYRDSPAVDPTGPGTGQYRVARGAFWRNDAEWCRTASRNHNYPDYWLTNSCGFRVVLPE